MSQHLLPQFIFSPTICKNNQSNNQSFFSYDKAVLTEETETLKKVLDQLSTKDMEVFCWILLEENFNRRQAIAIEKHLETSIENLLNNDWEANVILIPSKKNATIEDYFRIVEPQLHTLSRRYPSNLFGHIIGYGNQVLSQAILVEGIRNFKENYASIYGFQGELFINQNEVQMKPSKWIEIFRSFILDYDYKAALDLLKGVPSSPNVMLLKNLISCQLKRQNFTFEEARDFLQQAVFMYPQHLALEETSAILQRLLSSDQRTKELERIVELIRHIDVNLQMDDTPSFLVRFYRAREAVLYYLLKFARTDDLDYKPAGNKSTIYQVFEELEELYDSWDIDGYYGAYFFLKSQNVSKLLQVRNRSFIGHSRSTINEKELWYSFTGTRKTTFTKAKRRFLMDIDLVLRDLGIQLDSNMMAMNQLILEIAEQWSKEEGQFEYSANYDLA